MRRALAAAAIVSLAGLAGYRGRGEGRPRQADERAKGTQALDTTATQAPDEPHPGGADLRPSASVAVAEELVRREQLQADAHLLDLAQGLLDTRDQARAALLLAYVGTDTGLGPADAQALALALDCMHGLEEGREEAEHFLRTTHGSRLRKQLRNICLGVDVVEARPGRSSTQRASR